ncbi:MAG: DUF86 domain-containing protein [Alphaproteobacteria bacterium]
MAPHFQSRQQEAETEFIEGLRARYEDEGFTFTAHPEAAQLPDFLGSYAPDALAQKPGHNIVIEVKNRQSLSTERTLGRIRQLFKGRPDWQFHVVFMGANDPLQSMTIPTSAPVTISNHMNEIRALTAQGHPRPAFIMAWSILEAALRTLGGEAGSRPHTLGTVVQELAMNGYIEPDMERRLRALIELRNRIVHGDLSVEPETKDIELVLSAIEETLNANAS